jgi:hypothetical protein
VVLSKLVLYSDFNNNSTRLLGELAGEEEVAVALVLVVVVCLILRGYCGVGLVVLVVLVDS